MIQSRNKLKEIAARITMGITLIVVVHVISNFILAGFGIEPLAIKGTYHNLDVILQEMLDVSEETAVMLVNSLKLIQVALIVWSTIDAAGDWLNQRNNKSLTLNFFFPTLTVSLVVLLNSN